jgi:molybdopterin molybdotransferase
VEVLRAVASGENVLKVGEDVAKGDEVIPAGVRLRPAEIGGLVALGFTRVRVASLPRIGILSSGDEVVPPDKIPGPGQVRDVNAYTLSALVDAAGGQPVAYGIVPDQEAALRSTAARALSECDGVVITAGSSASTRDLTAQVINALGRPGVLVHGVNVRPGKPTILAICDGKPVIGLPGNPVSALVIASLFVTPVIQALLGLRQMRPLPSVPARLALNLASQA